MTAYVWGAVILAVITLIAGIYFYGRRAGRDSSEKTVATKTADVLKKMNQAGADAPSSKSAIVDRLREKGL